jgi:hypothetical protein
MHKTITRYGFRVTASEKDITMKMKIAAAVLIGLGAVLIVYNVYNALFTGTEFERNSLKGDGEAVTRQVELTPDMNPLRALVRAKYEVQWYESDIRSDTTGRELRAEVSMLDPAGKTVWEDSVDYYRSDDEETRRRTHNTTQYLRTFEVPRAGTYTFMSNVHVYRGSLEDVELVLKQNVAKMSVLSVILGVFLVLAGLVMGSADQIKQWLAENIIKRPKST